MKWIIRLVGVLVIAVAAIIVYAMSTARGSQHPVGFETVQKPVDGRLMAIGLWYPTDGTPRPTTFLGGTVLSVAPGGAVAGDRLPLVVLSHGNGAGLASHADLAMDLASAGYVVAAPMHPGDNYLDQSAAGSPSLFSDRAQDLRATIDFVLDDWAQHSHVERERVGAYGFSAGAFTVLTLVGARPDFALIPGHCARNPELICMALKQAGSPLLSGKASAADGLAADPRIKAAVLAAPGLGFTFKPQDFARVSVPVQLWSGSADTTVPFASNAQIVRDGLGRGVEFHEVQGASHFSFMTPCRLLGPPALCADAPGFDRQAFHSTMNAEVIRFFNTWLGVTATRPGSPDPVAATVGGER